VIADTATGLAKNVSLIVLTVHRTTGGVTKLKRFACIDGRQGVSLRAIRLPGAARARLAVRCGDRNGSRQVN
jgi:hypothetical protein